jgi:threonine dehydrogenase-like Zn-dependent dehydrogenase
LIENPERKRYIAARGGKIMKAAVLHRPYDLIVEKVPRPKACPGMVVVRIKATAICGTDVGIYTGKIGVPNCP